MNQIRAMREKRGMSQVKLGLLAGLPNSLISDFELNKRVPWPKARRSIAHALNVTQAELFNEVGN